MFPTIAIAASVGRHSVYRIAAGRVVAAEAAEVPVAVHQRQPHGPRLGEPDEGVVDRAVAVRVQAAHDVADDAGALDVPAVGPQAHRVHLVEDRRCTGLRPSLASGSARE